MKTTRRGELFRNTQKGKIAGVCAGLADYFGWETWLIRVVAVSCVLLGAGFVVVIYIAGWFILDKAPTQSMQSPKNVDEALSRTQQADFEGESIKVKAKIWQAGEPPKQAFHDIRRKFKRLENELQKIERYVTSPEFTVSREINKL